jgi:ABC-type transport system involved in Fe-S cluster assembly fused permease/ATPase subunit
LDNAKGAKATDALLNYETVKLFNNEALERRNFANVRRPGRQAVHLDGTCTA